MQDLCPSAASSIGFGRAFLGFISALEGLIPGQVSEELVIEGFMWGHRVFHCLGFRVYIEASCGVTGFYIGLGFRVYIEGFMWGHRVYIGLEFRV